jgi:hypothetical protein
MISNGIFVSINYSILFTKIIAMSALTRPQSPFCPHCLMKNLHSTGVSLRTLIKPVGTFDCAKIISVSFILPGRWRITFFNLRLTNRIKRQFHLWKFNFMLAKWIFSSSLMLILRRDPPKLPYICFNDLVQLFSPPGSLIRFIGHVV